MDMYKRGSFGSGQEYGGLEGSVDGVQFPKFRYHPDPVKTGGVFKKRFRGGLPVL